MKNYYSVLEVPKSASDDEIKKAWHNYCNEDLETFHYGFYVELQKMNNEKDTTNE